MDEEKLLKRFGEHIRLLRQNAQLSQEQLAEKSGLDRTYISGIERGKRNVSLVNLLRVSVALGLPASRLLEFSNDSE